MAGAIRDRVAPAAFVGGPGSCKHGASLSPASRKRLSDGTTHALTTRAIVIAAGARPLVPPIPGLAEVRPLTSDTVWDLRDRPARLVVLGGGPIGCELAQAFARFGTRVTVVEQAPRLLTAEDDDCAAMVEARFAAEGLDLRLGHRARRVEVVAGQ